MYKQLPLILRHNPDPCRAFSAHCNEKNNFGIIKGSARTYAAHETAELMQVNLRLRNSVAYVERLLDFGTYGVLLQVIHLSGRHVLEANNFHQAACKLLPLLAVMVNPLHGELVQLQFAGE